MSEDRLTKSSLVDEVSKKTGLTKVAVEKTITEIQESIINAVANDKRVTLSGFMSFVPYMREPRTMSNPKTGEEMEVKEKRIVKTKVLRHFSETVCEGPKPKVNNDE